MANTGRAAWSAIRRRPGVFERTPKFGVRREPVEWLRLRYQVRVDAIVLVEGLLAAINVTTVVLAVRHGSWAIAVYATIFACGLGFSVFLTLSQAARGLWLARAVERLPVAALQPSVPPEA